MNHRQVANKALELADELDVEASQAEYGYVVDNWKLFKDSAAMLRSQEKYINLLHKLLNKNGIGSGRNLLTGEIIPFEEEE